MADIGDLALLTLSFNAMASGGPRLICSIGKVFSGVPDFVTCVAF